MVFDKHSAVEYYETMSKITQLREALGYSQAKLADLAGTKQPTIGRLESGKMKLTKEWAERLAPHLGTTAEVLLFAPTNEPILEISARNYGPGSTPPFPYRDTMPNDLPVMGTAAGSHDRGAFKLGSDVIDWVRRPAPLAGTKDSYALYVEGSSMEPQYFPGDLIFVNPTRPVKLGDMVVVQWRDTEDGVEASIGVLIKRSETSIVLRKRNPATDIKLPRNGNTIIHRVLTNNEVFGV